MKNITHQLAQTYSPWKALLFYRCADEDRTPLYVEAMDINSDGVPQNVRPLQSEECRKLAELLRHSPEERNDFLSSRSLIAPEILQVDTRTCTVIWYARPQKVTLFFTKDLGIPEGKAFIPALIWKATRQGVSIWSFTGSRKPVLKTPLCHAPFFNVSDSGTVCMGNVNVRIDRKTYLEDFTRQWESYFFNSYFTHLLGSCPVSCNIVQLWKDLVDSGKRFPEDVLKPTNKTLKHILV